MIEASTCLNKDDDDDDELKPAAITSTPHPTSLH